MRVASIAMGASAPDSMNPATNAQRAKCMLTYAPIENKDALEMCLVCRGGMVTFPGTGPVRSSMSNTYPSPAARLVCRLCRLRAANAGIDDVDWGGTNEVCRVVSYAKGKSPTYPKHHECGDGEIGKECDDIGWWDPWCNQIEFGLQSRPIECLVDMCVLDDNENRHD